MTFVEFKKLLLDADITLPKFSRLIKVSEKNLQAYKKREEVPNPIAALASCFATMRRAGIDYRECIENLDLKQKRKEGAGFAKKRDKTKIEKEKK